MNEMGRELGKNQKEVVKLLKANPGKYFGINQVIKELNLKIHYQTMRKSFAGLIERGLIEKKKVSTRNHYKYKFKE